MVYSFRETVIDAIGLFVVGAVADAMIGVFWSSSRNRVLGLDFHSSQQAVPGAEQTARSVQAQMHGEKEVLHPASNVCRSKLADRSLATSIRRTEVDDTMFGKFCRAVGQMGSGQPMLSGVREATEMRRATRFVTTMEANHRPARATAVIRGKGPRPSEGESSPPQGH